MLGLLPDLTPRDSHSVWYAPFGNPTPSQLLLDNGDQDPYSRHHQLTEQPHNNGTNPSRRAGMRLYQRSKLARLQADEQAMSRRLLSVQNFGSTWLKPTGVPKTLHQMREERREAEEHAEAVRREQLQQELAEAEATGLEGVDEMTGDLDDMGDGARDLDEDIPDADALDMDMSGIDEDSSVADDTNAATGVQDDEEDEEAAPPSNEEETEAQREERRNELVHARMRMADDAFRQAMARGEDAGDLYGAEEELEAEQDGQLLLEEDGFRHARVLFQRRGQAQAQPRTREGARGAHEEFEQGNADDTGHDLENEGDGDGDLYMDADLDEDVPEASDMSGGYEHTDSEAELSSSDNDDMDLSFAPRSSIGGVAGAGALRPPSSPTLGTRREGGRRVRPSAELSTLLSGESSVLGPSPRPRENRP